jgi:hypothetical protein
VCQVALKATRMEREGNILRHMSPRGNRVPAEFCHRRNLP